jgi:hypothetical protein
MMVGFLSTPIEEAFKAEVIEDSISPYGIRLTTLQLRYPRFIHAEFMTHRQFSRNARSSRAVPTQRLLNEEPYVPSFMANGRGMQSFVDLSSDQYTDAVRHWWDGVEHDKATAQLLMQDDVHKQWANRMLEWFGYIDVVVSSTFWKNFFNLRDHPMAMPEIQHLARAMRDAMDASSPKPLDFGQWHLPYVLPEEREGELGWRKLISTARCARVSYKPFDGSGEIDSVKDVELAERLIIQDPLHASPAEHQATPDKLLEGPFPGRRYWQHRDLHGNFRGWKQHRKFFPGEVYNEEFDPQKLQQYYEEHHGKEAADQLDSLR